ncbi:ATP-dependent RNA helicase SrmB [Paraferrimonas sedimenticola]|uniref:ATP-dependent RNA helicase SrmB n=1 Tax=Paraferrimonas sedimenticola TaxID=375674 RepID=A0AA37RUR4_9GAMM|nr:ATP-dependent RNA helicase SrmB [Paraferrimonas sedimenticola]GLP95553.1 ATP-dependent RNA helicase SrmB [Paraferrimonas sedimenticola]
MSFDHLLLDAKLMASLERMDHQRPTTIQESVLPLAMDQQDILASAPTGTGKTAAFLLPILQHLIDFPRRRPGPARALVLTPTRELAAQIHQYASHLAHLTELKIGIITGGQDYQPQLKQLAKNMDLLVATPGRLVEYIANESFSLEQVEILVIDEADRMLDMGFRETVKDIATAALKRQQTMLFSATLNSPGVEAFADALLDNPQRLEAKPPRRESGKIHQWMHLADDKDHKFALLCHWLNQEEVTRAIVFVKKRETVAELEGKLQSAGITAAFLRGDMEQRDRFRALSRLVKGEAKVLIATDVAARGIDVENISHVINFDMPRKADIYVHRIGRTGRAGAKGTAISLVEAHDIGVIPKIERFTDQNLKRRVIAELRPKHKEAKAPTKKKVKKKGAAKTKRKAKSKK